MTDVHDLPRRPKRRVIDQALCDRAHRLSLVHPLSVVASLCRLHPSQITRIKARAWQAASWDGLIRPAPCDLTIQQNHLTFAELCSHYGCATHTMSRWLRDLPNRRPSRRGENLRRGARP